MALTKYSVKTPCGHEVGRTNSYAGAYGRQQCFICVSELLPADGQAISVAALVENITLKLHWSESTIYRTIERLVDAGKLGIAPKGKRFVVWVKNVPQIRN